MLPTVGRIVHFYAGSTSDDQAYAAIVTGVYVDDPFLVDLVAFGRRGLHFHQKVQPDRKSSLAPLPVASFAYWTWPPRSGEGGGQ